MTIRVEHLRTRGASLRIDLARYLPSLLLAGYGIFILSLFVRQQLTLYINPSYIVPSTLAGALLVLLAVVRLTTKSATGCVDCGTDSCAAGEDCDCASSPRLWPYLILSVPLLLAILVPPRGLAAFSARQRGVQIAGLSAVRGASVVKHVSLSVDTRSFGMQDWVGALSADPNPKDYLGKPVILKGLVIHAPASVPPGYIMVLRYQVTCCIADARPEGLVVRDISKGRLQDNQWVEVKGSMGETTYQGQQLAVVNPKQILPTKAGDPYMY